MRTHTSPSNQIPYLGRVGMLPMNIAMAESQERLIMNPASIRTLTKNNSLEMSTPGSDAQMSHSMYLFTLLTFVPPLILNSNSHSNSKTIMASLSKLPNMQSSDSQDVHSFHT